MVRDQWGRPFVTTDGQPLKYEGKKKTPVNAVGYTRVSTLAGALDDKSNLGDWLAAQTAVGLIREKSVAAQVASLVSKYKDPWSQAKTQMKQLVSRAQTAASSDDGSGKGTAFHEFTEIVDAGGEPEFMPEEFKPWMDCYREVMSDYEVLAAEEFVVVDELQAAGSFDKLLRHKRSGRVQIGDLKGLPLNTKIPTPGGWSTMAELQVGDSVFGSDGRPCTVTAKSDVKRIGTFVVEFDDKSEVVCDSEHLWWTFNKHGVEGVRSVSELIDTLRDSNGQCQHKVPVAGPLSLPTASLPIPPYLLGAWLGDGHSRDGVITKEDDLFEVIASDGIELGVRQVYGDPDKANVATRGVVGMTKHLRALNLLHNKHIPALYMRASFDQRLALLRGLMDTDGTWNTARKSACFYSTDLGLARQVEELLLTLGQRPSFAEVVREGFGIKVMSYDVKFTPVGIEPFRLPRKLAKMRDGMQGKSTTVSERRLVKAVRPGPDVETVCIAVDSPNRTYLCTERFIPTHNTGASDPRYPLKAAIQFASYAHGERYDQVTGAREVLHADLDLSEAVLIHVPIRGKSPSAAAYSVDIGAGWEFAKLAVRVREARKMKPLEVVA